MNRRLIAAIYSLAGSPATYCWTADRRRADHPNPCKPSPVQPGTIFSPDVSSTRCFLYYCVHYCYRVTAAIYRLSLHNRGTFLLVSVSTRYALKSV